MKYLPWAFSFFTLVASATPHPHPGELVPIPRFKIQKSHPVIFSQYVEGSPVWRVQLDWSEGEKYALRHSILENSGTPALQKRSLVRDPWGSYIAELKVGERSYFDSIGTGKEYRRLALSLSFRFPLPSVSSQLKVWAENPQTGVHEVVFEASLDPASFKTLRPAAVETRVLREASTNNPLIFSIYAEGYQAGSAEKFFTAAQKVVKTFEATKFPGQEHFRFVAVFAPSAEKLGNPRDLGPEPLPRKSFLGLYFPHWNPFGRWTDVLYGTNEDQLRSGFASVAYDYPLALIDDNQYWGIGNYHVFTAIPATHSQFSYLLLHEFGHYMGLNEEYEEGGRTELEFAPGISEPWSANMTFHPRRGELKWEHLVAADTPLPTSRNIFDTRNLVGAYRGGYAVSEPLGVNHKPVQQCTMNGGGGFCPVCNEGLLNQIKKDSGDQELRPRNPGRP